MSMMDSTWTGMSTHRADSGHGKQAGHTDSGKAADPKGMAKSLKHKSSKKKTDSNKSSSEPKATVQSVLALCRTRWQKDDNLQQTYSRFFNDLGSHGLRKTDKMTFENLVDSHIMAGKQMQNAWKFLESGEKARIGFGKLHFKAWEAAFSHIQSQYPENLKKANVERCMKIAQERHQGVFGKHFKTSSYL